MPRRRVSPKPPPEATLIARRRLARTPRLSVNRAAQLAGISPQSWTNVETGQKVINRREGMILAFRGSADMIARMALVVGVGAEELRAAGREDAAEIHGLLLAARPSARYADVIGTATRAVTDAAGLTDRQRLALREAISRIVDENGSL